MNKKLRVLISGGGTGGHIFPALSIADALKKANPDTEILFVGAEGRMEMEKVPAAGYKILALPIAGLKRSLSLDNLALPFKVIRSIRMARRIIREFKPDIAVGVGGYASAPLLWAAERSGVPTLIQEQNGFAGLTNRILGRNAGRICVAYSGMERFFPADRIVMTGNPIRGGMQPATPQIKAVSTRRRLLLRAFLLFMRSEFLFYAIGEALHETRNTPLVLYHKRRIPAIRADKMRS